MSPVILQLDRKKELNRRLMLFFTGFSRFSSDIQNEARLSIKKNESQLLEMLKLVDAAEEVLTTKSDLAEFGRLLDYTWKLKRNITKKYLQMLLTYAMKKQNQPARWAESC